MLYAIHELQHTMLAPWVSFAEASLSLYTNPFSPFSYFPISPRLAAGSELMLRLTQRYTKPLWQIEDTLVDGQTVPVCDVAVLEKPFCRLIHFERAFTSARKDPKVLLVAPLSGHHATLLRDTVRTMLPEHDVYVTDWVDARMVPVTEGPFHLDDYVDYVREFVRFVGEGVHVISVCQPTVPVLAAISLIAQHDDAVKPRTMTMMGGPIDARKSPTAVNNLAMEKPLSWFKRSVIQRVPLKYPGYMRQVYPGFLQHTGFVAMNPSRHAEAHWDFYNHLVQGDGESAEAHRKFYDEYNAVLDMPAEYYIDTIKTVFQEFALPKGRMFVREELVRPSAITKTALLTIEGEFDDISGNGQTAAAHDLCTGIPAKMHDHFMVPKVGHYGIFSGRRWRDVIYPHIRDFVRKYN
jgi:poly(3-hydroxybutyrate) depolymerase